MSQNLSLRRLVYSVFAGSVFMFMISCQYEFIVPEEVIIPDPGTPISFSEDIIPIFNEKCNNASCHRAGFAILDLSEANAHADLFRKNQIDIDNPEQSPLYLKLTDPNGTHKGRSDGNDWALILEWIKQGAKDN